MHSSKLFRSGLTLSAASYFLCVLTAATPAYAGFQWVSPENASGQQVVAPTPAPLPPAPVAPTPAFPAPRIIEATEEPVAPVAAPAPVAAAPAAAAPSAPLAIPEGKTVRGFANNVPLSVALRQILPQEYGFSVAQDVSLGTQVSWRGGAPWRQVLRDMLSSVGLSSKEEGGLIQVVRASAAPAAPIASAPAALPPIAESVDMAPAKAPAPRLQPADDGKPMKLAAPASQPQSAPAPLPTRNVAPPAATAAPTMGYLVPPANAAAPAPTLMVSSGSATSQRPDLYDAWTASKGDMLHKVLDEWCRRAGVELTWQAEYDYPLQASVLLNGSFEDAVRNLLAGFQEAKPQPIGQLYNSRVAGQAVLVVQARGNNYND